MAESMALNAICLN